MLESEFGYFAHQVNQNRHTDDDISYNYNSNHGGFPNLQRDALFSQYSISDIQNRPLIQQQLNNEKPNNTNYSILSDNNYLSTAFV